MYTNRKQEFRYAPVYGADVIDYPGGGTIDRSELKVIFRNGDKLDELPPGTPVVKGVDGLFHVVKTARVFEPSSADKIKVEKGCLFVAGDAVTIGGAFDRASDVIKEVDRTTDGYDTITLSGAIGSAVKGEVLVLAKDKQAAGSAVPKHGGKGALEVMFTKNPVDLTVANQAAGLIMLGQIFEKNLLFPVDSALKAYTKAVFIN